MNFKDLGLIAPILRALDAQGYAEPTPIQAGAIPPALLGRDVTDPEELTKIKAEGLFYTRCPQFVDAAVQLVEELLEEA